ncbi:disintegrin and metalloproteinase domain-containing protein 33-like [Macrobrachium rosenbergii]|uniref:disintegrin and metalloproteinase domain-containing protein 33-like n=1 Tax=Macrobrachium rosenbergii TaxID=79674 RepID=UPI0034D46A62
MWRLSSAKSPLQWVCMNLQLTIIITVKLSSPSEVLYYNNETNPVGEEVKASPVNGDSAEKFLLPEYLKSDGANKVSERTAKSIPDIEELFDTPDLTVKVQPLIDVRASSHDFRNDHDGFLITITFRADSFNLTVDLKPTWDLLAASYEEPRHQPRKGRLANVPCEWQGTVRGLEEHSIVALSICPVIRGIIIVEGSEAMIEAAPGSASPEDLHQITTNSLQYPAGKCGVPTKTNKRNNQPSENRSQQLRDSTLGRKPRHRRQASVKKHGHIWTNKKTRFVELVVVADTSYYKTFKADVYDRLRATVNAVNAIFREIGIVVVLTDVEVWTSRDRTTVDADFKITLSSFAPYRMELLKTKRGINNDNTVLITTVDFHGTTVGYAYVGEICSNELSVATVQDRSGSGVGTIARTMAHEIGHILGMSHDENDQGGCCEQRSCIMSSTVSAMDGIKIGWSPCSKDVVMKAVDSLNYECLRNIPANFYEKTCGNGVLDDGEQCDCGPPNFCDNLCCDPKTCQLVANATCAHGSCCNIETCHLHQSGRTCREKDGDCDLPEFCSGISEYCPDDVHVRDGTPCERGQGYCFKGTCGNPLGRCKKIWGPTAGDVAPRCLDINEKGTRDGNCGWTDESRNTFRKCPKASLSCGTLHCNVANDIKPQVKGKVAWSTHFFGSQTCKHITGDQSLPENFWLSPDGTPCGRNGEAMCINQQCIDIAHPNGVSVCPMNCSGRGICNSRGNCHCDPGFAPPDCVNRGHGGSYDSNYISSRGYEIFIDAILIILAIIIPIVAFICCSWEKIRIWWEQSGYLSWKGTCPCCATCINACCCPVMSKITYWCVTVGHKKKTDMNRKEIQQVVDDAEASTVCQVMVNMGEQSMTNSWGVADDRLFTEVVKVTPKNSPDLSRKIVMKSNSPVRHHKSVEGIDRVPPYQHQSVSVDSGCVSDDDVNFNQPIASQMSMTSLIGAFSRFSNKSVKSQSCKDLNQRPKAFGSQKSIPLSRFVVDPLAGNRQLRQETPPPDDLRSSFSRSISTDATSSMLIQRQGPMQPSSAALKPHKSDDNIHNISDTPKKNRWSLFGKTSNADGPTQTKQKGHETAEETERHREMRPAPPPPPPPQGQKTKPPKSILKPKNEIRESDSKLKTNGHRVNQEIPSAIKETTPTPPAKRPIMPPKFRPGPSPIGQDDNKMKNQVTDSSTERPVPLPKTKPQINLEKSSDSSKGPNVKALARKLGNQ